MIPGWVRGQGGRLQREEQFNPYLGTSPTAMDCFPNNSTDSYELFRKQSIGNSYELFREQL